MAGWVLAVDFGTSNTAAAHTGPISGVVETLPLSHNSNLMSSSVFMDGPQIVVGDVALNAATTNPAAFVSAPKRSVSQGSMLVNFVEVRVAELVSAVLRAVLNRGVAQHDGALPDLLVLTHPVGWSPAELEVLFEAAAGTGIDQENVRLVSEPDAAAHYYTRSQDKLYAGERIAVFDYGGGTLDVAVLAATDTGTFTVLAARGNNAQGGKNIDALLRQWIDQQLENDNPELLAFLQRDAPAQALRALDDSIRSAKELLSEAPRATITVVDSRTDRPEHFTITRDDFEQIISKEIDAGITLAQQTLTEAGISGADLKALYLTGGSSRIPLVHKRLEDIANIATLDDPKTVVAQGAIVATLQQSPPSSGLSTATEAVGPVDRSSDGSAPVESRRRRKLLAITGAVAVLLVGAGTAAVLMLLGDSDGRVSPPSAPDAAASEQAILSLINRYIDAETHDNTAATLNTMRCGTHQIDAATFKPPAGFVHTLEAAPSIQVNGATAEARVQDTATAPNQPPERTTTLVQFVYDGEWKLCGGTSQ